MSVLVLPSSAAAASPDATPGSVQSLQLMTVDDTGPAAPDHDVTLIVRLLQAGGAPFTSAATVSVTVTLDDGSAGGAGSHPDGLVIDGATVTAADPTVARSLSAVDEGRVDVSIAFPTAAVHLVRLVSDPVALSHPSGITLAITPA